MPPVPADTFAREFRALHAADRTAFVAALWNARGWETSIDDGVVLADQDGEQRRIGVVDPGRFGTPTFSGLDTLVVACDREAVRSAADEAGVEYVSPSDLRDLLLYGVEREVATGLYEEYVGKPLARAAPEKPEKEGEAGTLLPAIAEIEVSHRALAAIVILALVGVALAGPGLPGSGADPAPITVSNVTPEDGSVGAVGVGATSSTDEPAIAPGVTLDGVESGMVLADAHVAGARNRSRIRSTRLVGPPNGSSMGGASRRNTTARITNESHFYYRENAIGGIAGPGESAESETYAEGGPMLQRLVTENETRYFRYGADEWSASDYDANVQSYLYRYFVGAENSVVTCAIEFDRDCPTYRVAVEDPPNALGEEIQNYSALLIVSDRGVITTIRVQYTLPDTDDDGEREQVRFALDYRFDDVSPEAPDWLPKAKNATANETATQSPTPSG